MIEIKGLFKTFGKLVVLDDLDLSIRKGGIFAVLGPNGSGKTTLIKSILGMVIPDEGEIGIDGQSVLGKSSYRNEINYLPQIANFPSNLTVRELLAMVKNLRPKKAHDQELIDLFGLDEHLEKKLGNLSGGTKQKVNIVLTFMFDSDILVLDEPTTGLDKMLRRRGMKKLEPRITAGPGSLSTALGFHKKQTGIDLCDAASAIWIEDHGNVLSPADIVASPRVGVGYAEECAEWPWRFRLRGNAFTSPAK